MARHQQMHGSAGSSQSEGLHLPPGLVKNAHAQPTPPWGRWAWVWCYQAEHSVQESICGLVLCPPPRLGPPRLYSLRAESLVSTHHTVLFPAPPSRSVVWAKEARVALVNKEAITSSSCSEPPGALLAQEKLKPFPPSSRRPHTALPTDPTFSLLTLDPSTSPAWAFCSSHQAAAVCRLSAPGLCSQVTSGTQPSLTTHRSLDPWPCWCSHPCASSSPHTGGPADWLQTNTVHRSSDKSVSRAGWDCGFYLGDLWFSDQPPCCENSQQPRLRGCPPTATRRAWKLIASPSQPTKPFRGDHSPVDPS